MRSSLSLGLATVVMLGQFVETVRAVETMPIYSLNLMGGQYFFSGAKSNINGNAVGNLAEVVKFDDRWSLLPSYNVSYQGTKQVTDPVASGTLFQQSMDHRASVTGIYTPPGSTWKFKPALNYKREFIKETVDEDWGKGLFDYQKFGLGFEAENVYKDPFSCRLGYDFYFVRFPNYQSLESQSGVDPQGNPLGRAAAGADVLDTMNHQLTFSMTRPFPYNSPRAFIEASYGLIWQMYRDQPIVDLQGQLTGSERQDFIQTLSFSIAHPRAIAGGAYKLQSRFGMNVTYDGSNQNEFDAAQTVWIPDNYSYYRYSLGPSATLAWGNDKQPTWLSAGFSYSRTQYLGRLAQTGSGAYTKTNLHSDGYLATLSYSYPIAPNFSLKAQTNFYWATSNMAYQALYRYTYRSANYLFGFTYDY